MGPCIFLLEHLFCLSHHKTHWTMSVDNVGPTADLELHDHSDIFFLVQTEVVMGRIQQPITYFIGSWNDFMVHGVNNP